MMFTGLCRRFDRAVALGLAVLLVLGCGTAQPAFAFKWFVDASVGDLNPADKVVPAKPGPVQVLVVFQRDGSDNPKATKVIRPMVIDALKGTGAFTDIGDAPVTSGAVLSITINDKVDKQDLDKAKSKGFGAGLSFGLLSGVVAFDHFEVTLDYAVTNSTKPIEAVVHHAVAMKFGNISDPPGVVVAKSSDDAIKTMIRQSVDHGVNMIVADPAFPRAS